MTTTQHLIHFCSFQLIGHEKCCLLSKDTSDSGYLPVGTIIPHITPATRFEIMREEKSVVPVYANIEYMRWEMTLGEIYDYVCTQTKNIFFEQEQITASLEKFESSIIPRPYLSILGDYSSFFFFKEGKKIFVAEFKTSSEGNECDVYELNDDSRRKNVHVGVTSRSRIIFPRV